MTDNFDHLKDIKRSPEAIQIIKDWIAALRDGSYKQGRKKLKSCDRFCCMGVLLDIVDPSKWVDDFYHGCGEINDNYPPTQLQTILGMECDICQAYSGGYSLTNFCRHLGVLNDDRQFSFLQIADYLEEKLLGKENEQT